MEIDTLPPSKTLLKTLRKALSMIALMMAGASGVQGSLAAEPISVSAVSIPVQAFSLTHAPGIVRIVLVGDSTVTDNAGWGRGFARAMSNDVEVTNLARGGSSSKSSLAEGMLRQAVALKPDYLLIQFGHNDQPGKGERSTDPQTTYRQAMTQYVDEAKAAGIKPVLVTSLSRRNWDQDGLKIISSLQPWVDVVKEIAASKNVPVVDLHDRSIMEYEKMGKEGTKAISPTKNADPGNPNADTTGLKYDGTHLNEAGGLLFGRIVAEELGKAVPELSTYGSSTKITKEQKKITVSADGSGDFKSLQEAINAVPENSKEPTLIHLKAGTYTGPFVVPESKSHLTLEGQGPESTVLDWDRSVHDPIPEGHDKFNPGLQVLAPDFRAVNLTIRNSAGDRGQALAIRVDADRVVFKNCHILGWQDTLLLQKGRSYFKECLIAGRVDFIYGDGTALFERCEIRSKNGGHVTAANTPADHPFGFVFLNCRLTADPAPWIDPKTNQPARASISKPMADLGRPWRPYASVTYLNCEMGDHITPVGWNNWGKPENEKTARYAEYNSSGPGANPGARAPWTKQLSKEEAAKITVENVLGGQDGWRP
jgi:pectinesterase